MAIVAVSSSKIISDGDGLPRSKWLEREWVLIDALGTIRNSLSAVLIFLGTKIPIQIAAAIPGLQVIGGLLILHSAKNSFPKSFSSFVAACKSKEPEGKVEGIISSGLAFANQILYVGIGGELAAAGVTGFLSPEMGHIFAYHAVLGASVTAKLSNFALGITCVVRGTVMVSRALYNLSYLVPFHNELKKKKNVEDAFTFLKTEFEKGKDRFIRRVGKDGAEAFEKSQNTEELKEKQRVVELVDKALFKQKMMQYLTLIIGILMIAGGIAAIVFSAGAAGLAIAAVIGVASILYAQMEALWLVYDSSPLFDAIVDRLYRPFPFNQLTEEQKPSVLDYQSDVA